MNNTVTVPSYINCAISDEAQDKIFQARIQAEKLQMRNVKCPRCGYNLLEVFGFDHHLTRVKCQKCKFTDIIDTALFRQIRISK